jgi:hypothetical protein
MRRAIAMPQPAESNFRPPSRPLQFSLLDGLSRITEMTQRVAEQGMPAAGIKPTIGIEADVAPRGMTDKAAKADADHTP